MSMSNKDNLFTTSCEDLLCDVKQTFEKNIPTQNSTFLLYTTRGLFQNLYKNISSHGRKIKKKPELFEKVFQRQNLFSGFIEHLKNLKQTFTVDFWTDLLIHYFPPIIASNTNAKIQTEIMNTHRFQPYNTEPVYFPLVIYLCIFILVLFFITLFVFRHHYISFLKMQTTITEKIQIQTPTKMQNENLF